ncbi:DegT/DnrJ/EryC1/StrS aminotransferase family protein [mine drainage metagenome]|uniref:DegT/DnrJ/EryC1/StrS aminotransferase family protein n=1 Tax=mine drainage metagenome TaxID=410659 RepID=A0A1J5SV27_9ZZZZ
MADIKSGVNLLFLREEELRQGIEMLFFAYRDFTAEPDVILADYGFGRAHHRVIYFVGRSPGITVSDLLATLGITKQSLSRVLSQLVAEGFNGKLSEFAAAIGLAQDRMFDAQLGVRRAAAARYARFLAAEAPGWAGPQRPGDPPWQGYPVLAPSAAAADACVREAAARGVQLRRYYRPALHLAAPARRYARGTLAVSADLAQRMLCLPMYSDLDASAQADLLGRLREALPWS